MKIIVVGCGTTGNLIIPNLKGDITIIDRDIVEKKNLNRLIQFTIKQRWEKRRSLKQFY